MEQSVVFRGEIHLSRIVGTDRAGVDVQDPAPGDCRIRDERPGLAPICCAIKARTASRRVDLAPGRKVHAYQVFWLLS